MAEALADFDREMDGDLRAEVALPLARAVDSLARVSSLPQDSLRNLYVKARIELAAAHPADHAQRKELEKRTGRVFGELCQKTDTSAYPYDHMVFRYWMAQFADSLPLRQQLLTAVAEQASTRNDSLLTSKATAELAAVLARTHAWSQAAEFYRIALQWNGTKRNATWLRLLFNRMNMLLHEGKATEASAELKKAGSVTPQNNKQRLVLANMKYLATGDTMGALEIDALAGKREVASGYRPYAQLLLYEARAKSGNLPGALAARRKALEFIGEQSAENLPYAPIALRVWATADSIAGLDKDYALHHRQAIQLQKEEDRISEASRAAYDSSMERLRTERKNTKEKYRKRTWYVISVYLIVLLTALVLFLWLGKRRGRIARAENCELLEQLNKGQRRLTVAELKLMERERNIEKLTKNLTALKNDNSEVEKEVGQMLSQIKQAQGEVSEWEKFRLLFAETNPGFIEKLKDLHPTLTVNDLRTAALIRMGLDKKHMARILSIHPDSVKKNRQRLRTKLNLPPDALLKPYLENL